MSLLHPIKYLSILSVCFRILTEYTAAKYCHWFKKIYAYSWKSNGNWDDLIRMFLFTPTLSIEAAVRRCFSNKCSSKFLNTHRKTSVLESLFNNGVSSTQVFSCEYCEIFKNSFFYRTPPVAASVSSILQEIMWQNELRFSFFCILTHCCLLRKSKSIEFLGKAIKFLFSRLFFIYNQKNVRNF